MSKSDYRAERREYTGRELHREDLSDDPLEMFSRWLAEAKDLEITDPTAMTVATADGNGVPTARTILLKHFDSAGLCWYTDKRSPQGVHIDANPQAELLFFWRELSRQIRVRGRVESATTEESDQYFAERPLSNQISAMASAQSSVVVDRATLEARVDALEKQYPDGNVPRPAEWGGYRLIPDSFEFWQGRESRLHDRFQYRREGDRWRIERLAP